MEQQHSPANGAPASNRSLSEPHFDDEATLLSARPVVPFHELKGKTNSRRRLVFGFAMVATLIIGALGGAFYARFEGVDRTLTVESAEPAPGSPAQDDSVSASADAGSAEAMHDKPKVLVVEKGERTITRQVRNPNVSTVVRKPAPGGSLSVSGAGSTGMMGQSGLNDPEYVRQMRRAERREVRRLRREKREKAQSSDDLLRIREIFEGSPRP